MEKKINEIVFREDLYPRFEPNQETIRKYSNSLEYLPPIKIDQHNILIDGFHRLKAHELAEQDIIKVEIIEVKSEKELKQMAYRLNSNHGMQLRDEEKKSFARQMIGDLKTKEIADILSVTSKTILNWTTEQRKALKEEEDRKLMEEYLRAHNTQKDIAEIIGLPQQTIGRRIEILTQKRKISEMGKEFDPFLYNIWNLNKGKDTDHFGHFPKIYMNNLLYYHTKPFDIIYDPFVGDGTTIDSCKEFHRRYYCSDMKMKPGREKDMIERKIQDGYPKELGYNKPDLVFLDPPYWKQAEGKYSDSEEDLGNMELKKFYDTFNSFLKELIERKIEKIAIVIQPTQWKNDMNFEDHIFKFHDMLKDDYFIEMRYILPYTSQQYNAQMVNKTKELKKCLTCNRDLVIWRRKKSLKNEKI